MSNYSKHKVLLTFKVSVAELPQALEKEQYRVMNSERA